LSLYPVILRKRSPSQSEELPTKDLCIADDSSVEIPPNLVTRLHSRLH